MAESSIRPPRSYRPSAQITNGTGPSTISSSLSHTGAGPTTLLMPFTAENKPTPPNPPEVSKPPSAQPTIAAFFASRSLFARRRARGIPSDVLCAASSSNAGAPGWWGCGYSWALSKGDRVWEEDESEEMVIQCTLLLPDSLVATVEVVVCEVARDIDLTSHWGRVSCISDASAGDSVAQDAYPGFGSLSRRARTASSSRQCRRSTANLRCFF